MQEMRHVLQDDQSGPVTVLILFNQPWDFKKQCPTRVRKPSSIAGLRKALARKTGRQHIYGCKVVPTDGYVAYILFEQAYVRKTMAKGFTCEGIVIDCPTNLEASCG